MKKAVILVVALVIVPALLIVAIAFALQRWVGSDDFRGFVSDQATTALGVPVVLGAIKVDVWPLPAVALEQVQVKSQPPLTLERVLARPSWAPLLCGRLEISTLRVTGAMIPEQAVGAIVAAFQKKSKAATKEPQPPADASRIAMPQRVVMEGITWVSAKGVSTTADALATFDDDGLPGTLTVQVRKGNFEGVNATLAREPDHFALRAEIGGGTITGKLTFDPGAKGLSTLQGHMDIANVEIAALTAPARTLTGKLEAHGTLKAEFADAGALVDALRTDTKFTVRGAVVHGLDLASAVKTVGASRGGETRLDALAGNVVTHGRVVQVNNLVATSGVLSANGNVAMAANRALSGRITVDLAGGAAAGALGIPLAVGGTLESPSVTLSRGALVGAAIGTLIAPGLGTGAGAKTGDKIGDVLKGMFGK